VTTTSNNNSNTNINTVVYVQWSLEVFLINCMSVATGNAPSRVSGFVPEELKVATFNFKLDRKVVLEVDPPCANYFRLAPFNIENIIYI
jgi:hypothetical protein